MKCHDLISILKELIYLLSEVSPNRGKTLQEAANQLGDSGSNPSEREMVVAWTKVKLQRWKEAVRFVTDRT